MQSFVSVCNAALAKLGGAQLERINSPEDDGAVAALCRGLMPQVRQLALTAHPWTFARTRRVLALKERGEGVYGNRFDLPEDCLKAIGLAADCTGEPGPFGEHSTGGLPYIIEGRHLLTAADAVTLIYVTDVPECEGWPAEFTSAVVWLLAAELATAHCNDLRRQQTYLEKYEVELSKAQAADLAQQNMQRQPCRWLRSRR